MDALFDVGRWPVPRAAAGAMWRDGRGHLVTATVGEARRRFPLASVTKLFSALAVLVAAEEGTLALDEPAGPPGSTVRHLLAHASGLAPDYDRALTEPGTRRIYSNAGYRVLGATVAARAEMTFADYLHGAVLAPLGLSAAMTGEAGAPGGAADPTAGWAAAGLAGSVDDLLALAAELLGPRLVAAETLAQATTVAFGGLGGVLPGFGLQEPCDWGLGFELRDAKAPHWTGPSNSPRTFGHFGRAGGFVWVDPVAQVALAVLTDRAFGPWALRRWPALAEAVLGEVAASRAGAG